MPAIRVLIIFVAFLAVTILPTMTIATTFIVGDDSGWTKKFDYQNWAKGKEFKTGDVLVFNYAEGEHTVFKVNGTGFQNCIKPPKNEALTTGNDKITLATPGDKWYICGVGNHCVGGQKLKITVADANSAHAVSMPWENMMLAALITMGMMIIA